MKIKKKKSNKIFKRKKRQNKNYLFKYILIKIIILILLTIIYYLLSKKNILLLDVFHDNKILIIGKLFNNKNKTEEKIEKKESKVYTKEEIDKIINNYLLPIPSKYDKNTESKKLHNYLSLKILPNDPNSEIYLEEKKILLGYFIKHARGKNFTSLDNIYLYEPANFGNRMQMINNIMYYCEILGCKNIYLNSQYNWFIKNTLTFYKYNISIVENSQINCKELNTFCINLWSGFCLNPLNIRPEIRINLLKNEINNNLPKINIDPEALYMHIRAGDIFSSYINEFFPQPPLCFYKKILHNFKFKNIYIIAKTNNNPVIDKLLNEFPNIIFKRNDVEIDIAYLINAYNLVGSVSTMLHSSIILNANLKLYWEYDIYRYSEKFCHLHYDIYEYPRKFLIYQMKPSENYKNEMFAWKKTPEQLQLMIEEKCNNDFSIIKPNV